MTPSAARKREEWIRSFDDPAKVRRLAGVVWRCNTTPDEWLRKVRSGQKWCRVCRAWHPVSKFYEDARQPDGLHGPCRDAVLTKLAKKRERKATA